ncbi:hypothetical protein FOVG_14179 [Fusarium oxysporum f. sp. pisi HDV247]|nr:hypothetical protein FOVG_14179 [Fusarium oxysporum f. sp. pisi HDV247]
MSGPSEVLVEVFSATCGCQKQHPINRNHSEMVKYSGVHDQLYRRVLVALRPILGITQGRPGIGRIGGVPQVCVQLSSDEQECLKSLSFPEQEHRYSEISYANDTCDWLIEDHKYQRWMNSSRGLFWIKGCPGTGKSVLMKFAVDMMDRRKAGELVVSFFIHGRGVLLQRTPLGMLRALLNSLLRSFPKYLTELTCLFEERQQRYGSYEQRNGWQWNEKELLKFLSNLLIQGTKEQAVVIFIDALDECGEDYAKSLLVSLKQLTENAEHEGSLMRICFSSRHFPILGHETMARIYVEEKNDKDIRLVIEGRLKELQPVERRRQIEKEIMLKAHGGFQWAILITNMILDEDATGAKTEDLIKMISAIPADLDDLYDVLLKGTTKDKHKQMVKLFQWVVYAKRPLSAQELREAVATDKDMTCTTIIDLRSHGNWSDCVSQFEMRVRHISRGLVEFQDRDVYEQYEPGGEEWSREAQFIHQSAADFVIQKFLTNVDAGSTTASPAGIGHFEISRSFLKYLALEEILNESNLSRQQLSAAFPLLPYGVAYLLSHILDVEHEGVPQTDLLTLIQWDRPERLKMLACIWRIMDPEGTHAPRGWPFVGATVLHVVVASGSASLLNALLQKDESDLAGQDSEGNTPLHLALRENNEGLALMILNRSKTSQSGQYTGPFPASENAISMQRKEYLVHINAPNHDNETPLALALSVRAGQAIQGLIDVGAEVKNEKSLVFYAISTKDKALLSRLIESGADLAGAAFFTLQCLDRESHRDDILHGILESLLDAGADTSRFVGSEIEGYNDMDDSDDDSLGQDEEAIFFASRNGRAEDVSLLLSYGSPATLRTADGAFPLLTALDNGNLETAKVLLRAAPETAEWPTAHHQTILDMAIGTHFFSAVHLLIQESGGRVTSNQALLQAIVHGAPDMVEEILQVYGNPTQMAERPNNELDKLLFLAVHRNLTHIVQVLVDIGKIDTSIRDENGNTPLHIAVKRKSLMTAKLLLDAGRFEFSLEDDEGYTLLGRAIANGDKYMVRLLLRTEKIDISLEDDEGYTPLYRAIMRQDEAIFKLLLDTGKIDINRHNADRQTPLRWTIELGSLGMIKLLLKEDAVDINQKDETGQAPLWWAIQEGREEVVQMLLDVASVDMHSRNKNGRTALWWATENRKYSVIQQILQSERFDILSEDEETIQKMALRAIENGQGPVIQLLLSSGRFSLYEKNQTVVRKLAVWSIENNSDRLIRPLLQSSSFGVHQEDKDAIRNLAWQSIENGKDHVIQTLVESGIFNMHQEDEEVSQATVTSAIENRMVYTIQLLLEWGAFKLHTVDDDVVRKIFWLAVGKGNERLINLVHDSGRFGVNTKDGSGKTPLMNATEACAVEALKVLLKTGKADVQAVDNEGNTALSIAVKRGYKTMADLLSAYIPSTDIVMRDAKG